MDRDEPLFGTSAKGLALCAGVAFVATSIGVVVEPRDGWGALLLAGVFGLTVCLGAGVLAAVSRT